MAKFKDDTLENKFIEGEVEMGDINTFVDDEDDERFIDEDAEDTNFEDDDDEDFDREDDDDLDDDDDDEDKDDEDNDDVDDKAGDSQPGDSDESEWYVRGQSWIESGRLAAGTEIPKNASQLDLEDLYMKQVEKNVESRFQAKYADLIQAKGINPDEIFTDQPSYEELELNQAKFIASLSYDAFVQKSQDAEKDLRNIGKAYHISRNENLEDEEVNDLIEKELNKFSEEELFAKYQAYFNTHAKNLEKQIQNNKAEAQKKETEKATKDAAYIREKIKGKYTDDEAKKILDGMFLKNQVYDNGKGYRKTGITLLEKNRLESAADLDAQLEMAINIILKPDPKTIKEKHQTVGAVSLMQKLAEFDGISATPNNKSSKKTTNNRPGVVPKNLFLVD